MRLGYRSVASAIRPRAFPSRLRISVAGLALALTLGGCATVETLDGRRLRVTSGEFRDYAQAVFRRHNRVVSDLLNALDVLERDEPALHARLLAAEAAMLKACAALNERALAARDQDDGASRARVAVARSVPRCDEQTRAVEKLLEQSLSYAVPDEIRTVSRPAPQGAPC